MTGASPPAASSTYFHTEHHDHDDDEDDYDDDVDEDDYEYDDDYDDDDNHDEDYLTISTILLRPRKMMTMIKLYSVTGLSICCCICIPVPNLSGLSIYWHDRTVFGELCRGGSYA